MFRKLKFNFPLFRFRILFISVFTCALFIGISIFAQVKPTPAGERMKSVEQRLALEKRSCAFRCQSLVTDTVYASDGSPQNCSQSEYADQHEYSGNGHGNRTHGIIGKIGLRQPLQDAGVLHNCGE